MGLIWERNGVPVLHERPDSIFILEDKDAISALSNYFGILRGEKWAKYLIAKSIQVDYNEKSDVVDLFKKHDMAVNLLRKILSDESLLREYEKVIKSRKFPIKNLLSLKYILALRILEECRFCEWNCRINRTNKQKGVCGLYNDAYIASMFIHIGEEPELVPSFTIFFSHCNFKCVFCQNWDISQMHSGRVVPADMVAREIDVLTSKRRIRNVNWVGGEPTPNLHYIIKVLLYMNANIPIVWNSNMYMSLESMKLLNGIVDVWLPDFKYGNNKCGERLSKVKRYFDVISRNHKLANAYGDEMIIRHLVLPNHLECCTIPILDWIKKNLDLSRVRVNIMAQYHPDYKAKEFPDISRSLTRSEWLEAIKYARTLGLNLTV